MNFIEATKAVGVAVAACPTAASFLDETALEAMVAAWLMVLEDLDAAQVNAALKRYLATTPDKLPSPGRLRQIVDEACSGRRRCGGDAWGDVLALLRPTRTRAAFSLHRHPTAKDVTDPIAWRALSALTWPAICAAEETDPAPRSQFIRLYDQLAAGAVEDRSVATLPGVARPALPDASSPAALVGDLAKRLTGSNP